MVCSTWALYLYLCCQHTSERSEWQQLLNVCSTRLMNTPRSVFSEWGRFVYFVFFFRRTASQASVNTCSTTVQTAPHNNTCYATAQNRSSYHLGIESARLTTPPTLEYASRSMGCYTVDGGAALSGCNLFDAGCSYEQSLLGVVCLPHRPYRSADRFTSTSPGCRRLGHRSTWTKRIGIRPLFSERTF